MTICVRRAPRRWPAAAAWLVAAALLSACNPKPTDERSYVERVTEARAIKDAYLKDDRDSPVPENRKQELLPLLYYPIDPAQNIPAVLKPSSDERTIMMSTSAGTQDPMRHVGTLEFAVSGQPMKLSAFAPAAARTVDRLFVPFRDLTSGKETYGGGRYLDIDRTSTNIYELDFNRAYTPNCYFSPTWICPLPPAENSLPVPIEAGEKVRVDH